jgi:hypothetical protein
LANNYGNENAVFRKRKRDPRATAAQVDIQRRASLLLLALGPQHKRRISMDCNHCGKPIEENDVEAIDHPLHFHFNCWIKRTSEL